MRNGIKSIFDYDNRARYEARRSNARITFLEPCFPTLEAPSRVFSFWNLSWTEDIPTEEGHTVKRWGMVYMDSHYQLITFEDGTEMVVTGEHRDEDMQKLQEYISNGYSTESEMSRAARLLDDEMMYEI